MFCNNLLVFCLKLMLDSLKGNFFHTSSICAPVSSQMILPEDKNWHQHAWVMWKSASHFTFSCAALIWYTGPLKKDCLWGFFSVNVILLQTSLWKCHPATLFISSPALFSIIHYFPLPWSHTPWARLFFELYVLKCDCETERMAVLDTLALCCYGLMLFAQPWSPVIEDSLPFPTLQCCRGVQDCISCQSYL